MLKLLFWYTENIFLLADDFCENLFVSALQYLMLRIWIQINLSDPDPCFVFTEHCCKRFGKIWKIGNIIDIILKVLQSYFKICGIRISVGKMFLPDQNWINSGLLCCF